MKCFYHNEKDAVATCQVCGKALCADCAASFDPPVCIDCAKKEVWSIKLCVGIGILTLLIFVFYMKAAFALGNDFSFSAIGALFWNMAVWFGVPFGIKFLRGKTYTLVIGNIFFMLMYYVILLMIGALIGPFAAVLEFRRLHRLQQSIAVTEEKILL